MARMATTSINISTVAILRLADDSQPTAGSRFCSALPHNTQVLAWTTSNEHRHGNIMHLLQLDAEAVNQRPIVSTLDRESIAHRWIVIADNELEFAGKLLDKYTYTWRSPELHRIRKAAAELFC